MRLRKRFLKEHERKRASAREPPDAAPAESALARMTPSARAAVVLMVAVTLMWSIAGVVTRHLEQARSFEVTFWRSFFTRGCRCW